MRPLEGIVVLDLSRILTGPFCTMTLADMGADVIKIEPPLGDDTRSWGPPFVEGESAYFLSINRNKKSIVINLKEEEGRKLFLELVKKADVVVENFRPGTLQRLGLDYENLKKVNERIILASISGFGQTGRYASRPGYDILAQAMGGLMSVTGQPDTPPVKAGFSIADIGAGMWATIGILLALMAREKTGKGQWIETSLLETIMSWQTYLAGNFFATGEDPAPVGSAHPNIVPYQAFAAKDGYLIIAAGNDILWARFCEAIGMPELIEDDRFKTNALRVENRQVLVPIIEERLKGASFHYWVDVLTKAGVPAGPVYRFSDLYQDPYVSERQMRVKVNHAKVGEIDQVGIPVKMSETPGAIISPPPLLGQHTREVLQSFGLNDVEIQKLKNKSIIK